MPHILGNAGGPSPPTRNEAKLQAELLECQARLRIARALIASLREDPYLGHKLQPLFVAYDKVIEEAAQ